MPYTPLVWTNGVTALEKINMDHLETQYDEAKADTVNDIAVIGSVSQVGWVTAPTSLTNAYNENCDTATTEGEGSTSPNEANNSCQIKLDLGANYLVSCVLVKLGFRASVDSESWSCRSRIGLAGDLTDTEIDTDTTVSDVETTVYHEIPYGQRARYIAARIWRTAGGGLGKLKVYEFIVYGRNIDVT